MSIDELQLRFFDGYLGFHPEEATTLGLTAGADRLRDHSPAGLVDEQSFYASMCRELADCGQGSLTLAQRLEHATMQRIAEHHEHLGMPLWGGLEWSMYPCTMLQMQLMHASSGAAFEQAASRLAKVGTFLSQHQHNLLQSRSGAGAPDSMLTSFFVDVQLPAAVSYLADDVTARPAGVGVTLSPDAARGLQQASAEAAQAYREHLQWLRDEIVPHTRESFRLGEEEVCWRLQHTFGIDDAPAQLIARAEHELAEIQRHMVEVAAQVAQHTDGFDAPIAGMADARALADKLQAQTISSAADIEPTYRGYIERAQKLVADAALFNVPRDYAFAIVPLPPGLDTVGHAANWPAPLLDRSKLGHFAVAADPAAHSLAWAADLAIHEGFPGHHLQSLWWQRRFGGERAPVRFLLVHDQVAIPRHYWGAMLNIEGYAVYAEELMRAAGLFTPQEEMFVWLAHAVRAARVVVDLGLHCGSMQPDEAISYLMQNVCFDERTARLEVRRYQQIPLQACTYLLGRLAIEDLKQEMRSLQGTAFAEADFHDAFFGYGPVAPSAIRECMIAALGAERVVARPSGHMVG